MIVYKISEKCFTKEKVAENALYVIHVEYDGFKKLEGKLVTLWNLIDGKRSEEDLILKFSDVIGEAPEEIKTDVEDILSTLLEQELIVAT